MQYNYSIADVFTDEIFQGAQIAVFPKAEGLNRDTMQRIAKELNLSETVFVFGEDGGDNHFRLRTFSPQEELEFGGHPMIATAWVLTSNGSLKQTGKHTPAVFEQNTGPVDVFVTTEEGQPKLVQFTMAVDATVDRFVPTDRELASILSLEPSELGSKDLYPMLVSCGRNYLIVPVPSYQTVRKARFNFNAWSSSSAPATLAREILLVTPTTGADKADFHARILGPDIAHTEDPPIGTAMPAFTAWLCQHEQIKPGTHTFTIDRGMRSTRRSELNIEMDNKPGGMVVRVGGPAVLVAEGRIMLPD